MMIINQHYNSHVVTRRQQRRYNHISSSMGFIPIIITTIIFSLIAQQSPIIVITATSTIPTINNVKPSVVTRKQQRQRRQIPSSFLFHHRRHTTTTTNTFNHPSSSRRRSPLDIINRNKDKNPTLVSSLPLTILHNHQHQHQQQSSTSNNSFETTPLTIKGPFTASLFSSTNCWGRRPLLIKNAFDPVEARRLKGWPTKEEVLNLAIEDEDEEDEDYSYEDDYEESDVASRLISHHPGDNTSYKLLFGPFSSTTLSPLLHPTTTPHPPSPLRHTLLINDIDRHIPSVSTWMDAHFSFLPRWRRDDGQISLTQRAGGIGPHVDHYDVFLIQLKGSREWRVGRRIVSVGEERSRTVENGDVRVLKTEEEGEVTSLRLEEGDCLYVPPRFRHDGIAATDDCMTLSVGCRAPSAGEMMVLLAEEMMDWELSGRNGGGGEGGTESWRYRDDSLLDGWRRRRRDGETDDDDDDDCCKKSNEITREAKNEAKALVKRALSELLDDDDEWDKWFGRFVSESKRNRSMSYPMRRGKEDVRRDLSRFCNGVISLYQAEGLIFAFSRGGDDNDAQDGRQRQRQRLFVNGEILWEDNSTTTATTSDDDDSSFIVPIDIIANERCLTRQMLSCPITGDIHKETKGLLKTLLMKGFLRAGGSSSLNDE